MSSSLKPPQAIVTLAIVFAGAAVALADETDRELIKSSTAQAKGLFHVVFTETIRSDEQLNWRGAYDAKVELLRNGKKIGDFRGSTLPNFVPGSDKPRDWKYAVVQATCSFPNELKQRFYTWSRTTRMDGRHPCLRLALKVPTVNLDSARAAELTSPELIRLLSGECESGRYLKFATEILVHSGSNQDWRGSAGCLTIHPSDADRFFDSIPLAVEGTLELNRVVEDKRSKSSHCY